MTCSRPGAEPLGLGLLRGRAALARGPRRTLARRPSLTVGIAIHAARRAPRARRARISFAVSVTSGAPRSAPTHVHGVAIRSCRGGGDERAAVARDQLQPARVARAPPWAAAPRRSTCPRGRPRPPRARMTSPTLAAGCSDEQRIAGRRHHAGLAARRRPRRRSPGAVVVRARELNVDPPRHQGDHGSPTVHAGPGRFSRSGAAQTAARLARAVPRRSRTVQVDAVGEVAERQAGVGVGPRIWPAAPLCPNAARRDGVRGRAGWRCRRRRRRPGRGAVGGRAAGAVGERVAHPCRGVGEHVGVPQPAGVVEQRLVEEREVGRGRRRRHRRARRRRGRRVG